MDTPVSSKPRTVFRSKYRPRLVKNQHELSSLMVGSKGAAGAMRTPPDDTAAGGPVSVLDRTGWSYRVEHAINAIIRDQSEYRKDIPIQKDVNRMFHATLSTVLLIAAGQLDIPQEHLLWSEAFLRGVRDRYGNHPPNVRKVLGFIKHINESTGRTRSDASRVGNGMDITELFTRTHQDFVPPRVTLTKIPPPTTV